MSNETSGRPLSALLSQALVAFTVEIDNEFERRMGVAGHQGDRLSLVVWSNLMRFVATGAVSVRELATMAMSSQERMKFQLGCLERWGFVVLQPDAADQRPVPIRQHRRARRELRDGWGSGRGIRDGWIVCLTSKGLKAAEIWPPLLKAIEQRWLTRFGKAAIRGLCESLASIVGTLDVAMPEALPEAWDLGEPDKSAPRGVLSAARLSLPALLSQVLMAFTIEFNRASRAPLALSANALRVLGARPVRVGDIPRLTGGSPEASGIGWQHKRYVVVAPDPAARGKVVRLTPLGLKAQRTYWKTVRDIEKEWHARFGKDRIRRVRELLQYLFERRDGDRPLLAAGLIPPPGVVRAGNQVPALGRKDVGAAARQRMRDLVAQTEAFVRDPAGTLPHYPLWDMNRGFGP